MLRGDPTKCLLGHMDSRIRLAFYRFVQSPFGLVGLIAAIATTTCLGAESESEWSRGVTGMVARGDQTYEFGLYAIKQDKSEMDGTWLYLNYATSDRKASPVARFDATKDGIGILWPNVRLEVQNELTGKWTLIGKSARRGTRMEVTVEPGSNVDLFVQLDAFKPFLGKHKVGRVVLTNGQASEFDLNYLVPPGKDKNH